jgi:hypothetical protein
MLRSAGPPPSCSAAAPMTGSVSTRPVAGSTHGSATTTMSTGSSCGDSTASLASQPGGSAGLISAPRQLGAGLGAVPDVQKGWPSRRLPANTRFFVIKSFCARDLKISMRAHTPASAPASVLAISRSQCVRTHLAHSRRSEHLDERRSERARAPPTRLALWP